MPVDAMRPFLPPLPGFRAVQLDGALLYFHPATGTHVRIANSATAGCRRTSPRVVMFGITNACNLDCDFCSRDRRRSSRWTVASAAEVLRDLAAAGTLEVAFGGGEPFVFPGFRDLLAELRETTPLALHVTTNGTRIDAQSWPAFEGLINMVRLSVYDEPTWRAAAAMLSRTRQRWGANLLVDDAAIDGLPERLAELAAAGCGDVSILTFVGTDPSRQLSAAGRARLATVLTHSPLAVRLSVCAGGSIPVATLPHGLAAMNDCGAGLDFVSITPDQGMLACSFQGGPALPARTADEILTGWRARHARMAQASPRHGCARARPFAAPPVQAPSIAIWRSYSGNNSGECVMVATFATIAEAERHLAGLLPGWKPDGDASAEWAALFAREQVVTPPSEDGFTDWCQSPRALLAIGRSILALGYGVDDVFAPLRALAWKQGAWVSPGGVHLHGPLSLLTAIRCRDADDARRRGATCIDGAGDLRTWQHGDTLLVIMNIGKEHGRVETDVLLQMKDRLTALAGGYPIAVEVLEDAVDDDAWLEVRKRIPATPTPTHGRLVASFWSGEIEARAQAFARSLGSQPTVVAGGRVLIDPVERPKRLAVLAYRRGAHVTVLDDPEVKMTCRFWFVQEARRGRKAEPKSISADAVRERFTQQMAFRQLTVTAEPDRDTCEVGLLTTDPGPIMRMLAQHADGLGCRLTQYLGEVNPLASALRRVMADVARS